MEQLEFEHTATRGSVHCYLMLRKHLRGFAKTVVAGVVVELAVDVEAVVAIVG